MRGKSKDENNMEVTIVSNGDIKDTNFLQSVIKNSNYIICADGAAKYLRDLNICPNLLVGDLDSINKNFGGIKNNVKIQQFPTKKI